MEVNVEVLVIGGGIQGVVALAELHKHNFKTLLVTESDIGGGQTLSSQAYLHSGYPWAQHEDVVTDIKRAANFWLKWMKVHMTNRICTNYSIRENERMSKLMRVRIRE
jgi:glycine/D-amino acid oxidase-like deaminating enzyme